MRRGKLAAAAAATSLAASLGLFGSGLANAADAGTQSVSCTKSMGQTWGKASCSGTGLWDVTVWCSLGAHSTSSTMSGTGTVYAYCPWGNAQSVSVTQYS
jgi:hypothetical protein